MSRNVHYVSHGSADGKYSSACRAAIIAEVGQWVTDEDHRHGADDDGVQRRTLLQRFDPEACALGVINPTGMFFPGDTKVCVHDEDEKAPGTWHWPERV